MMGHGSQNVTIVNSVLYSTVGLCDLVRLVILFRTRKNARETAKTKRNITRNVAIAQRDGRPAEHRWRPLFNAAKFG